MALSYAVLEATRAPATVEALARRLAVPAPHVRAILDALERRGYVRRLNDAGSGLRDRTGHGTGNGAAHGRTPREASACPACDPAPCGACAFRTACGVVPEVRWQRVADDWPAAVSRPPAP